MTYGYTRQASAMYQQTRAQGSVEGADPHQLIAMLLDGAIERIAQARGFVRYNDVTAKGTAIGKALAIVAELDGALDHEAGGDLARRLAALYAYVSRQLLAAQLNGDDQVLAECIRLLEPVRDGWKGIRAEYLESQSRSAA